MPSESMNGHQPHIAVEEVPIRLRLFMDALKCAVELHVDKLTPVEMLVVGSQMVGNLAAMQGSMTADNVMETIVKNIKLGNRAAIERLIKQGHIPGLTIQD